MPEGEVFEEVSLVIRSLGESRFQVTLATEAQAEVTETFIPPSRSWRTEWGGAGSGWFRGGERDLDGGSLRELQEASAREVGSALFESLLPGKLRRIFDGRLAVTNEVDPHGSLRGLRLRLRLDLEDAEIRPLATLPWELLHDPLFRTFYGQDRRQLLVRHLASPLAVAPLAVTPPLRILPVASLPSGTTPLELEAEVQGLRGKLHGKKAVELLPTAGPTLDGMRRALQREKPHVLHFLGHGSFDAVAGEGYLFFEDDLGRADPVDGETFAELLDDFRPHLRLVVLNACRSAAMSRDQPPWSTVGAALSLRGFPAVIAMQFRIADDDAIRFSETFYESLAAGDPVDVAVGEGRRELYEIHRRTLDWAAPVLFLRALDGRIFDLPRPQEPTIPTREESSGKGAEGMESQTIDEGPLVLGIRSLEPWGDRPKKTLEFRKHFTGRSIKDAALWETKILPDLERFLLPAAASRRPLLLDFAAHASIAFAAGWVLEAKSGLDITIRQRLPTGGFKPWNPNDEPLPEGPFWKAEDDLILDEQATDIAVALSLTWPVLDDVRTYLDRERLPIRRIVRATLSPEPGGSGVKSGAHCLALAQTLALRIHARTPQEHPGTLHLFISSPNVFPFYLGQLARGLGRIQMYEFAHGAGVPGAYTPSILLPPGAGRG
jgi:hypothetical protein